MKSEKREEEKLVLSFFSSRPLGLFAARHRNWVSLLSFFLFPPQALFLSLSPSCLSQRDGVEGDTHERYEKRRIESEPQAAKREKTESRSRFFLLATAAAPRWRAFRFSAPHDPLSLLSPRN